VIYIADASGLNAVEHLASDANAAFNALTDLVNEHELCFCESVPKCLARFWPEGQALVWAKAIAGSRREDLRGPALSDIHWVTHNVVGLIDPDASENLDYVDVLAHAYALREENRTVVTDDWGEKPTRLSLAAGCQAIDIRVIEVRQFFVEVDRSGLVA
jgi:hypothetical protein